MGAAVSPPLASAEADGAVNGGAVVAGRSGVDAEPGGRLFMLEERRQLTINLALVKSGTMPVDERVELIRIVDEILTELRQS